MMALINPRTATDDFLLNSMATQLALRNDLTKAHRQIEELTDQLNAANFERETTAICHHLVNRIFSSAIQRLQEDEAKKAEIKNRQIQLKHEESSKEIICLLTISRDQALAAAAQTQEDIASLKQVMRHMLAVMQNSSVELPFEQLMRQGFGQLDPSLERAQPDHFVESDSRSSGDETDDFELVSLQDGQCNSTNPPYRPDLQHLAADLHLRQIEQLVRENTQG